GWDRPVNPVACTSDEDCAEGVSCYFGCTGDPSVECEEDDDCTEVGGTCEPRYCNDLFETTACTSDEQCEEEGLECSLMYGYCAGPNHNPDHGATMEVNAWLGVEDRENYIFYDRTDIPSTGTLEYYMYGATLLYPHEYPVYEYPPKYCGTLTLLVGDNPCGKFTFSFLVTEPGGAVVTFFRDRNMYIIEPLVTEPLILNTDPPVDPPLPEEPSVVPKNRYISFVPTNPGRETALRVTLTASTLFPGDVGMQWWVGPPGPVSEAAGSTGSTPPPTFMAAELQSTWHCMDWSTVGLLDVSGCEIHPGATYDVQVIDCTCDPSNPADYSVPLLITTSVWGDAVGNCSVTPCSPPNGVADFEDISSLVDKFRNLPGAPRKARAAIAGDPPIGIPDKLVNFIDISYCVDAFRGLPYPFPGPGECP
ncbi:MAG: hypothetical protein WBE26_01230, partial [Phycisphaerae bacterium]